MSATFAIVACRDKVSTECEGTFIRQTGVRGRPALNCPACRNATKIVVSTETHRNCKDCGERFALRVGGKGRKAIRCDGCRKPVKVIRTDAERIDAIRAETVATETREIAEARGKARAASLVERMAPLIAKRNRELISA